MFVHLFLYCVLLCWCKCTGQFMTCTSGDTVGPGDIMAANVNSPDSNDVNVTILMSTTLGTIQCCGLVNAWSLYVEGRSFISLHVWRPVPGYADKYMLLGNNGMRHRSDDVTVMSRDIKTKNQIHVVPGDVIAIFQEGPALVRYITCDPASPTDPTICADDLTVFSSNLEPVPGDEVSFTTRQSVYLGASTVRGYAVVAHLDEKEPVNCKDGSETISDTLSVGSHVTFVSATNIDTNHPDTMFSIDTTSPALPVSIHQTTGEITVTGSLTPNYPSTVYVVTVLVTDVCGGTGRCNISITVTNDPKPIRLISLPETKYLSTWTVGEVHAFQISDQREVDKVTCYVVPTLQETTSFRVTNRSYLNYTVDVTSVDALEGVQRVAIFISCQNLAEYFNASTLVIHMAVNSWTSYTSGGTDGLVTIMILIGVIVSFTVIIVILVGLLSKGKTGVWPADNTQKLKTVHVAENNNRVKDATVHSRSDRIRKKTSNLKSTTESTKIWNKFDQLYRKKTSTFAANHAHRTHFNAKNGLGNQTSDVIMTSHREHSVHKNLKDEFKAPSNKPWMP